MKQFPCSFLVFCVFITTSLLGDTAPKNSCLTEVSLGELIDKITILQIKNERVTDPAKLVNIRTELAILENTLRETVSESEHLSSLMAELKEINTQLWVIEDDIREKESKQEFDAQFIALARSVYFTNDHRCEVKREINKLLGSKLVEEKIMLNTHQQNKSRKLHTKTRTFLIATFIALVTPDFAHAESGPTTHPSPDLQKHLDRAIALHKNQAHDQALALLGQLIDWAPDNTVFWYNKAYILKTIGRPHEAIPYYNYVLAQIPDHDHAHYGLAQASLATGDLKSGFYHFQWRLAHKKKWERVTIPEDLSGIDIVLRAEFGFGDMFQFIRYAHELKKRGCATMCVQAFKAQVPLFKLCPYIDHVIEEHEPLPNYGLHIPLLSVPYLLGTTIDTIPAPIPYLHADPELVKKWQKLLPQNNFKIGICWQGKSQHFLEENPLTKRSVPLSLFAPLAALPGVTLYSLQNGAGTEQLDSVNFAVQSFGPDFDSSSGRFMDTAAVIKNMDLIISVDTSLVHLAGGLGARTWVLIPYVAEWRWLETRTDTPWYPEVMKLWRQPEPGNWESVFSEITNSVRELIRVK